MTNRKTKILLFILGVAFGLFIGGGVVYLIDKYNLPVIEKINSNNLPKVSNKDFSRLFSSSNQDTFNKKKKNHIVSENKSQKSIESWDKNQISSDSLNKKTSVNIRYKKDTLSRLNEDAEETQDKDLIVMRDELITTKEFPIENNNINSENRNDIKLSQELTDETQPEKDENVLLVEFWKSPLNYVGYKMSNNKLIIYGIQDIDSSNFVFKNNSLFLEYFNNYYKLEDTDNFKPLIMLNNPAIKNKTKESKTKKISK